MLCFQTHLFQVCFDSFNTMISKNASSSPPPLGSIQQTLLLPLAARAIEASWRHTRLRDLKSQELLARLGVSLNRYRFQLFELGILGLAERAYQLDKAVRSFLETTPDACIVQAGAGLDTTFYRVDNGRFPKASWIDLDLKDSLSLRRSLLPEPERTKTVECSLFDSTWLSELPSDRSKVMILIPGVLMYFEKEKVGTFFKEFAPHLQGAQILFDAFTSAANFIATRQVHRSGMKHAQMKWHIKEASDVCSFSPLLKIVKAQSVFADIPLSPYYMPWTNALLYWLKTHTATELIHLNVIA